MGIDLGTTHTVVAYADTAEDSRAPDIELFEIEQLVAPGEVAARSLLPSLRYHPAPGELAGGDIQLPWNEPDPGRVSPVVIGELAREIGSKVPGRLVASAKSWLSHSGVDRSAPILPWGAMEGVARVSPLDASASYLAYVRAAWNRRFPRYPLERQDLVLTVPASFDEVARRLTVQAARIAGLAQARLLEEPQAACYDWLHAHRDRLEEALGEARLVLVCDVGGGTTDLTLIQVTRTEDGPRFTRVGVGDHLMLGGDNMDLTLAHRIEQRLGGDGKRLNAAALSQLVQQCRAAKERLLAANAPEHTTVTVLGAGARLIGGARSAELSREEVRSWLVDGFFPCVTIDERPQGRRGGIVEFGLPYAADPAVSRHLAAFLHRHREASSQALDGQAPIQGDLPVPDAVLLNGGVFHSHSISERLLEILALWRGAPLRRLDHAHPDLAVARGAVAYAMARRGQGLRIGGGSARSYFLLLDGSMGRKQGICLLPRGSEEDREVRLSDRTFSLRLGQPVSFMLASSTSDRCFSPGDVIEIDPETFAPLPPIVTVLEDKEGVPELLVQLVASLTEVGTLEMSCVAVEQPAKRWHLAFQLRNQVEEFEGGATHPRFQQVADLIERFYGPRAKGVGFKEIKTLRNDLERILGKREIWETPLLRAVFGVFWKGARRRRRSSDHERLWFSMAGYGLRPGYGYPLDDWRVQQLWGLYEQGVQHLNDSQVWSEWWTLWRRVAGGLERSAQEHILADILPDLQVLQLGKGQRTAKGAGKPGTDDMIRLAASLEHIEACRKVELGEILLQRLRAKRESSQTWWAIGRIGTRVPLHGSAHNVVTKAVAEQWLRELLRLDWKTVKPAAFAAALLARRSGDRERDIEAALRDVLLQRLKASHSPDSWFKMVSEVAELEAGDQQRVFGDALPPGLRLVQ